MQLKEDKDVNIVETANTLENGLSGWDIKNETTPKKKIKSSIIYHSEPKLYNKRKCFDSKNCEIVTKNIDLSDTALNSTISQPSLFVHSNKDLNIINDTINNDSIKS